MPDELARIERDLAAMADRLRELETIQSPMLKRALEEFRELQSEVKRMQEQGTIETRGQLALMRERINQNRDDLDALERDVRSKADAQGVADLAADVKKKADAQTLKELADDRKALVRIALAAVVAALLSLGVSLILRATGGG